MRNLLLSLTLLLAASTLHAQDLTGTWQGTIQATPNNVRTIVNFKKSDKGEITGLMYRPDETTWQPVPVSAVKIQGGQVTFAMTMMDATYQGKLSADGKFITGTWAHGPATHPLDLVLVTDEAAKWQLPTPPQRPKPMAANADPGFEVATIKPSDPSKHGQGMDFEGRRFTLTRFTVNDLIAFALGFHAHQIVGAPPWFATDLYDIAGVPDVEGEPDIRQMKTMLQKLLADRFQLVFHHDKKVLAVYAITVAKGGPKFSTSGVGPDDEYGFSFPHGFGTLNVGNLSMAEFAIDMQGFVLDKPVVDQTSLTGRYNFDLNWTPDDSQFAQYRSAGVTTSSLPKDNPNAPPGLYTAVQEQLGLKFEATKALDDVIVIDHVEKPSPN